MNNAPTINSDDRGIATQQRNVITRPSLRSAINAKCRECISDGSASGTWRKQIEQCTAIKCPLYAVRPVSTTEPVNALENSESGLYAPVSDIAGGGYAHR
jgi:hypothetical protein